LQAFDRDKDRDSEVSICLRAGRMSPRTAFDDDNNINDKRSANFGAGITLGARGG
jgi:hypothetical protein